MAGQRWSIGAVLEVPLDHDAFAYAQMLKRPEFAFFVVPAPLEEAAAVAHLVPIFRLWVHKDCFTKGRWPKIGNAPLRQELELELPRFSQDRLAPTRFSIWLGGTESPASRAECEGLECAAVWDPEDVEQRLLDHIAGVPNKWVESMRPKPAA